MRIFNRKANGDTDEVTLMSLGMSMTVAAIVLILAVGLIIMCMHGVRSISNANSQAIENHNNSIKSN